MLADEIMALTIIAVEWFGVENFKRPATPQLPCTQLRLIYCENLRLPLFFFLVDFTCENPTPDLYTMALLMYIYPSTA